MRALSAPLVFMVVGCSGAIDGGHAPPSGEASPTQSGTPAPVTGGADPWKAPGAAAMPGAAPRAGVRPLRRLSRAEYNNTLRDLLGASGEPANDFASDTDGPSGFPEGGLVSGADFDRMLDAADNLARTAVTSRLTSLLPCDPAKLGEDACAFEFIRVFGRRAYRHTLSADETADLRAVYTDARKSLGWDFKNGIRVTLEAMLLSPRFHYHWELGDRAPQVTRGLVALDGFELASRLSYFVWQSMPDDMLLDAGEKGELATPEGVLRHARRLLADPQRGPRAARGFVQAWLAIDDLGTRDATMPADPKAGLGTKVYASMLEGTLRFVDDLVLGVGDHRMSALLTAGTGFANDTLARVYGTAPGATDYQRVTLDGSQRAGILTQPAFLAATYSTPLATPIKRGRFLFERLATCGAVPPPEGMIPDPPPAQPGASVRDQLGAHSGGGVCAACHSLMDPLGFAFLGYDQYGRWRTKDEYGRPIDAHGTLNGPASGPLVFADAVELSRKLAAVPEAQRCLARQVFRYALRSSGGDDDEASATALGDLFVKGGADVRELLMAATQVFSFYYRAPAQGEVLQ